MRTIKLTKKEYQIKEGTKSVWVEVDSRVSQINETEYNNIIDSCPFFRRLGGSETLQREYTCAGYKVTRLISKSPDRTVKVIRTFKF